jgi:NAD(P)-dependent dehydrogenase (short-subunit alcohol dehydrogenase family)
MESFRDKVVLITGGSSGIGRAAAMRLASMGSKICVAARNVEPLRQAVEEAQFLGAEALAVPTDVRDAEECRNAVETAVDRFGKLDILICSAGLSMRTFFEGSDLGAMEEVLRVNLFGTLYATHFALPHIKKARGSLVAISSLTGKWGVPSYSIYGASKFAIHGLYESLRLELKRDGVHVGILYPGFVDTPLRGRVLKADGKPWQNPPPPPFRIWPVEKCVDRIVRLIVRRKARALLPPFTGPLLALDQFLGQRLGDRILTWKFPPLPADGPET